MRHIHVNNQKAFNLCFYKLCPINFIYQNFHKIKQFLLKIMSFNVGGLLKCGLLQVSIIYTNTLERFI